MRHGSLFSGIGGFDLAAEWMGWENRRFNNDGENGNASDSNYQRLQRSKKNRNFTQCREESNQQPFGFIRNSWQEFPTISPVCNGDDGLSDRLDGITFSKWRNESIKGGGNAIVPQVAFQIFKTIEQCEHFS